MRMFVAAAAIVALQSVALAQTGDLECDTAQASYELVPQDGASPDALLTFRGSETIAGLAGTITTGEGQNIPFDVTVSNGYSVTRAAIDLGNGTRIDPPILAFARDMTMGPLLADEQAPAFLVFANAGKDAYYAQMQVDPAEVVEVPETAWKLAFCKK